MADDAPKEDVLPADVGIHENADGGGEFEVEKIVKRCDNGRFQVRWAGFPPEADTFEPLENIIDCTAYGEFSKREKAVAAAPARPSQQRRSTLMLF